MSCVLRLSAPDIERRLAVVRIRPYRLERGTAHFTVSERAFEDLSGQVTDALAFLKEHGAAVQSVVAAGAEGCMDFAVHIPSQGFATRSFPSSLVAIAGAVGIGLELSVYPGEEGEHAV